MIDWGGIMWSLSAVAVWSVVYKHNPAWEIVENVIVGLGLAVMVYNMIEYISGTLVLPIIHGEVFPTLIFLILSLMVWLRFSEKTRYLSYWPLAIMTGVTTSIGAIGAVQANILKQTAIASFFTGNLITNINNFIMWVATITTFCYFIFTFKPGGIGGALYKGLGILGKIGRVFMMIGFATTIGSYIGEMTLWGVAGYATYYVKTPGIYIVIIAVIILIIDIIRSARAGIFFEET